MLTYTRGLLEHWIRWIRSRNQSVPFGIDDGSRPRRIERIVRCKELAKISLMDFFEDTTDTRGQKYLTGLPEPIWWPGTADR